MIIRSKPFVASELGGCEALPPPPPRVLKFSRARGHSNELKVFNLPIPRQFEY